APSSAGLVLATAILVLWAPRGLHPIAEIARLRKRPGCRTGSALPAKALPGKIILGIAASSSRPGGVGRLMSPGEHQSEVVWRHVIEQRAGLLVEHVGIELAGPQQRHAALPLGALALEVVEIGGQRDDLLVEVFLGLEPVIAAIGVDAEIADQERGHDIEAERGQDGTQAFTRDHPHTMSARGLKGLNAGRLPQPVADFAADEIAQPLAAVAQET